MFLLQASKNKLTLLKREPLTSGSVNAYPVRFTFSPDWEGLTRTAVFRYGGGEAVSVLLDGTDQCTIPWEVLTSHGCRLAVGVYGKLGEDVALPTVWAGLGTVLAGAAPGEDARPPTPELWRQELDRKGDKLDYTAAGGLGLYAGDKLLSAVPVPGGGGGGAADHRALSNRDADGQHPVSSITGLREALERIPEPVEPLTNEELEEMLQ